jgi:membrane peptidoglycan carboxypeptidase
LSSAAATAAIFFAGAAATRGAFKPIIYAAALENGYSQLSVVEDGPQSFWIAPGKYWRPLEGNLSLSVGSSAVTLLEFVRAYGVFADNGALSEPLFVTKIANRDARALEENEIGHRQVIAPEVAHLMTDMLKNVVKSGTGRGAARLGLRVAGKTGTTSEFRDGRFMGYTLSLVVGVWVGYDDHRRRQDRVAHMVELHDRGARSLRTGGFYGSRRRRLAGGRFQERKLSDAVVRESGQAKDSLRRWREADRAGAASRSHRGSRSGRARHRR